ncbi:ribonuclease III [Aspergillus mulundensis]|uniref:RNase III domain-containing protein n=1 Tax=Aspergillus mulundensis TaxID=1810919 RepID=A0A3D8T436_9EURO|nr:hypothetical protein DSM5745_00543 [Aspergillus mulundensis]RDW93221.1 hypothetical protein DSM5745_00543 [Aspergillus mulundensis]
MDRKRKSVFASYHDDKAAKTRKKETYSDHSFNISSPQAPSPDTDLQDDIQSICMLADKIIVKYDNGHIKLSPEVLEATKVFTSALQKTPPLRKHTKLTDPGPEVPRLSRHLKSLPPLPPVRDEQLERAVFTHPGVSKDPKTTYDRLEILGDAYIELFSTKLIWNRFQHMPSGRMSQIRELLVKNETLAEYATQYGIDSRASVPPEFSNQPKRWIKTRGDIFEAYVAAVILSHPDGYAVAESWLSELWSPKLEALEESNSFSQAKEALARKVMGKGAKLRYIDEKESIQHKGGTQSYFIGVYFTGWGWTDKHLGSGQGSNKTIAGNRAAQQALENGDLINKIVASKESHMTGRP